MKIKESEKLDKYLEHKNDCVIGALGTVPKGLDKRLEELEIRGRIETVQTTILRRLARIFCRVLRRLVIVQTVVKDHQLTLVWFG